MAHDPNTTSFSDWDTAARPDVEQARRRAAKLLWVTGAVEAAAFGCCVTSMAIVSVMPGDLLQEAADAQTYEQVMQLRPMLGFWAVTVFVLGFVPAVAYLILGFAVRTGRDAATTTALVLALTQFIVFGVLMIGNTVSAISTHSPADFTKSALTLGSLLVLLGLSIHSLWQARLLNHQSSQELTDPWDQYPK